MYAGSFPDPKTNELISRARSRCSGGSSASDNEITHVPIHRDIVNHRTRADKRDVVGHLNQSSHELE